MTRRLAIPHPFNYKATDVRGTGRADHGRADLGLGAGTVLTPLDGQELAVKPPAAAIDRDASWEEISECAEARGHPPTRRRLVKPRTKQARFLVS
jgi:hypothetical protein